MTKEIVYKNKWFKVIKEGKWHYIVEKNSRNGAVILMLEEDNDFIFVKNHRVAVDKILLELPRGYGDENEDSIDAAIREAFEETGYKIDKQNILKLGSVYPNSAILESKIDIFFAKVKQVDKIKEPDIEILELIKIPVKNINKYIKKGNIQDSFSLSALSLYYAL